MGRSQVIEVLSELFVCCLFSVSINRMIVFDIPKPGDQFEARFERLHELISAEHPFAFIPPRQHCTDYSLLSSFLKDMLNKSGEGVIIQLHDSPYEHGRSSKVIKLKVIIWNDYMLVLTFFQASRGDKEALVVSVLEDNSLVLKL
jgi:ATP-dependent DNA ligase